MKRLLVSIALALAATNAVATNHPSYVPNYEAGYRHGKNDAYHTVATTIVVVGIIAFVGLAIYEASDNRWGIGENGVTYRF